MGVIATKILIFCAGSFGSQQDLSSKLRLVCLMQCFRTGKESLHRITLSSDARTTPTDSLSFSLLPHLVPSRLAFPLVPLLSCPVATQAGAAHFYFPWASSFQLHAKGPSLHALCVPSARSLPSSTVSIYDKSSVPPPPHIIFTSWFITSEKALARKVSKGLYQLVIHFIMYFWQQTFF